MIKRIIVAFFAILGAILLIVYMVMHMLTALL